MSSIFHNAAAMAPFFDDVIIVEGRRTSSDHNGTRSISGTFRACVIDNGFADPIAAGDAESNVRTYTIITPVGGWLERTPPQTGDRITLENGRRLAVQRINALDAGDWTLTAKEVGA